MAIPEIFAIRGEKGFRSAEKEALRRVSGMNGKVVALGGGALLDSESRRLAESTGGVLMLDCTLEALIARASRSGGRPLLAGDVEIRLRRLMAERSQHYHSFKSV
jgi:shikimate kinase